MVRGPGDDLMLTEMDANGRDSTRTLVIDGKVAFHEIHTYNDDANLVRDFGFFRSSFVCRTLRTFWPNI